VVPHGRFRAMVEEHPRIGLELLHLGGGAPTGRVTPPTRVSTSDSLGRLCGAIVAFADRFGTAKDGVRQVLLPMGQSDLASWKRAVARSDSERSEGPPLSLAGSRVIGRHLRLVDERACEIGQTELT